jgi:fluoride ion exporter CrcB/FEX
LGARLGLRFVAVAMTASFFTRRSYPPPMPIVAALALTGALGALARYGPDEWIGRRTGAYTTFSTLSLDTYRLDAGQVGAAIANSLGSPAAGLAAVWAGIRLAQVL